jgi:hypothetical protein
MTQEMEEASSLNPKRQKPWQSLGRNAVEREQRSNKFGSLELLANLGEAFASRSKSSRRFKVPTVRVQTAVNYVAIEQGDDQVWDAIPAFVGATEVHEILRSGLVQSPGYGVVDSGCGRTLH